MPSLSEFLSSLSAALQRVEDASTVHVTVGSEACDLDSVACSIALAHYIHSTRSGVISLPVCQCRRGELSLRPDALWLLRELGLDPDGLLFAEDVSPERLTAASSLSVTLVDHNSPRGWTAPLAGKVEEVIDHHQREGESPREGQVQTVEMVGSCSTLVAEKLLADPAYSLEAPTATLLLGAILVDSANLAESEGRTTEKDQAVVAQLEPLASIPRATLFDKLLSARFDVSGLTTPQLLVKDYKEVSIRSCNLGFSSMTCLVSKVLQRDGITDELERFSSAHQLHVLILLGLAITSEGTRRRQIALYQPLSPQTATELADSLANVLEAREELKCERVMDTPHHWPLLEQHNTTFSRKHILPIITSFLKEMEEGEQLVTDPQSASQGPQGEDTPTSKEAAVLSVSGGGGGEPGPLEPVVHVVHGPEQQVHFHSTGVSNAPAIPEYTLKEESSENRTLRYIVVGGEEMTVNLQLIQPYRKLVQHGGYIGEERKALVVISACYLPPRSIPNYSVVIQHLFYYVLSVVDKLVTDDYIIVYLHGGAPPHSMPALGLLHRFYTMVDRRLRKQLMHLYIVHPTFWVKTMLRLGRPFVSGKFYRKVHFIRTLQDLSVHVTLEDELVPAPVLRTDNALMPRPPPEQRYAAGQQGEQQKQQ